MLSTGNKKNGEGKQDNIGRYSSFHINQNIELFNLAVGNYFSKTVNIKSKKIDYHTIDHMNHKQLKYQDSDLLHL